MATNTFKDDFWENDSCGHPNIITNKGYQTCTDCGEVLSTTHLDNQDYATQDIEPIVKKRQTQNIKQTTLIQLKRAKRYAITYKERQIRDVYNTAMKILSQYHKEYYVKDVLALFKKYKQFMNKSGKNCHSQDIVLAIICFAYLRSNNIYIDLHTFFTRYSIPTSLYYKIFRCLCKVADFSYDKDEYIHQIISSFIEGLNLETTIKVLAIKIYNSFRLHIQGDPKISAMASVLVATELNGGIENFGYSRTSACISLGLNYAPVKYKANIIIKGMRGSKSCLMKL